MEKDNPYLKILTLMEKHGEKKNPSSIEIAYVVSSEPLTIKIGELQLTKDDLLIADYLLKDYKRAYYQNGTLKAEQNGNVGKTNPVYDGGQNAVQHSHNISELKIETNSFSIEGKGEDDGKYFQFKDGLKTGDKLAVLAIENRQLFIVLARLIKL